MGPLDLNHLPKPKLELMRSVKWFRLLFLPYVPHPRDIRNMPGIGPVRMFRRYEMSLYDAIFVRFDYEGACEMYVIPKEYRRVTGLPIKFLNAKWTYVVHFTN